jgi:hypothetical protein
MLADYATATGGDIVYARKNGTMENLYSKIAEQARHAYTIAYVPRGNLKDSDFHAVRVTPTSWLTAIREEAITRAIDASDPDHHRSAAL